MSVTSKHDADALRGDFLLYEMSEIDWAQLSETVAASADAIEARDAEIAVLHRLLAALVDDTECRLDHHGGCQEHGFLSLEPGEVCPNHEARLALEADQ